MQCNTTLEEAFIIEEPIASGLTVHHLLIIISITSTAIAVVLSQIQIWCQTLHYLVPAEQTQVIRVVFMVPVYAICNLLKTILYRKAIYFDLVGNAYAAVALASFLNLVRYYVAPNLHEQKEYFRYVLPKPWNPPVNWVFSCFGGLKRSTPRSGLTWFNIIFVGVFQYCATLTITSIAGIIANTQGNYCQSSLSPSFGHIWIVIINTISAVIAGFFLSQFHDQLKDDVAEHETKLKYWAINIVLILSTYQTLLISALLLPWGSNGSILQPGKKVGYQDLAVSLASTILCFELALVSLLHLWAYPWKAYSIKHRKPDPPNYNGHVEVPTYKAGIFGYKAFLDALNPWDIVKEIARASRWMTVGYKWRLDDPSYQRAQNLPIELADREGLLVPAVALTPPQR